MPGNPDAERALLGLILLDPKHLREAERSLDAEDFFLDSHRKIFRAMSAVVRNGRELDVITLVEALQSHGGPESIGGIAYLASLTDGLPRRPSGASYIQQIREKAGLRRLLRGLDGLQRTASAPGATLEACHGAASLLVSQLQGEGLRQLARASADEFLESQFPPRQMVMSPILPQQGLAMLYSRRGVGKTYLALGIAHAVARGGTFLRWSAARPRRVLFVDGELPAPVLQQRLKAIISGLPASEPALPGPEYLSIVTPDLQNSPMPDLSTPQGQAMVEQGLAGGDLLVLDNLSCLCRSGKENEGESWLPVQDWALRLRQQGLSVLFVYHAGKGRTAARHLAPRRPARYRDRPAPARGLLPHRGPARTDPLREGPQLLRRRCPTVRSSHGTQRRRCRLDERVRSRTIRPAKPASQRPVRRRQNRTPRSQRARHKQEQSRQTAGAVGRRRSR